MSGKSKIEWTERTWNPVIGCTKVSAGCKNCYAEREWPRLAGNPKSVYHGLNFTDVTLLPGRLEQPLSWRKPAMVFVNSMSDLFHPDVPFGFVDDVIKVIRRTKHTYQILTKRPERVAECLKYTDPLPSNLWLGVSVEDQATANERIPLLLQIPAAVRFVSAEPLLGPVDFSEISPDIESWEVYGDIAKHLHWVIVGGESGPNARPMAPAWVRSIRDQCQGARVPFFFKQWGEWGPLEGSDARKGTPVMFYRDGEWTEGVSSVSMDLHVARVGKKAAGRLLDGKEYNEYPEVL